MVDREARREYAQLARQFVSGRMTASEYEGRWSRLRFNKRDRVLWEVYNQIDDLREEAFPKKMTKPWRLDRPARRKAAQAVLFLLGEQEYQWPQPLWDGSVFLITAFLIVLLFALNPEVSLLARSAISVPLVGLWVYYERWQARRLESAGDMEAWPFLHQADLETARRQPKLLNGASVL